MHSPSLFPFATLAKYVVIALLLLGVTAVDFAAETTQAGKTAKEASSASRKSRPKKNAEKAADMAEPENPFESGRPFSVKSPIDRWVLADLKRHGFKPSPDCSDAVFLRRIYLDTTGTIPTTGQAKAFLSDPSPDKRAKLIDRLLDSPEHAAYWALKWGDLLRIKAEFPINLWPNAAQAYDHYIKEAVRSNLPYDQLARELLTANGSNFRVPQANFFRAIQGRTKEAIAGSVALVVLGERADKMLPDRLARLADFFSRVKYKGTGEWKEEIVYNNPTQTAAMRVVYPDGKPGIVPEGEDPREAFVQWLTQPRNPFFARAQVNRLWNWAFGIPLYETVDNLSPESKARNPELADYLEQRFVENGFDMRALLREIFNSATYQQSSLFNSDNQEALQRFAAYPIRQMEAEALIDAICKITGTTEVYTSTTPEPYTTLPTCETAVEIPDGSITTAFLDLFGRPARDTGLLAERDRTPNASQRVHMLNATHIRRKLERGKFPVSSKPGQYNAFLKDVYLRVLSRYPTAEEIALLRSDNNKNNQNRRFYSRDIYWALLNSEEFLNRH